MRTLCLWLFERNFHQTLGVGKNHSVSQRQLSITAACIQDIKGHAQTLSFLAKTKIFIRRLKVVFLNIGQILNSVFSQFSVSKVMSSYVSLLFFKTSMLESDIQQSRGQTGVSCLIDFLVLIQNIS